MADMEKIHATVHEVILEVAKEQHPEIASVSDTSGLTTELGLRSLDLAMILAQLELRLEGDPFAELVPITSVRTVGDICEAYRKLFDGAKPSEEAANEGHDRAARRRDANTK